jgi:CheY-like chemotaxis protein
VLERVLANKLQGVAVSGPTVRRAILLRRQGVTMEQTYVKRRVLVVEDEAVVLMLMRDKLSDYGCELLTASTLQEAISLALTEAFDCAILDVKLGSEDIYPVAEMLLQRGIPFALSTGYTRENLPEEYRDRLLLMKPFSDVELETILASMLQPSAVRAQSEQSLLAHP